MPIVRNGQESIHQATNSLSITLCKRSDPRCVPTDDNTYIMHIFHWKSYYEFHGGYEPYVVLFKRNASIRQLFLKTLHGSFVEEGAFYSITYYVFDQYLTMISNTTTHLSTKAPSSRDQSKQRSCWERQTRVEMLNFAHLLTSQGLGLLYKMQCMDLLAQTEFMLDWFYKVSQSPDPLVLMVNGIDLHRKGTLETHPWQPWEGIDGQSYRSLAPWRRGSYFWDRDRIQSLGGTPL